MKKAEVYATEWAWDCPYCGNGNYEMDNKEGVKECFDCGKEVEVIKEVDNE